MGTIQRVGMHRVGISNQTKRTGGLGLPLGAAALCALASLSCSHHPDEGTPVEDGEGVLNVPGGGQKTYELAARPIMGGTLTVAADGRTAIASDPDRDAIFVVDLSTKEVTTLSLEHGEVPGRVVVGGANDAYVVLRDSAQLARIDLVDKRLVERIDVCDAPRGAAFDAANSRLYVTCQGGALLTLDTTTNELVRQIHVESDLRDVVISGDRLVVTTFRSSKIIIVDSSGQIVETIAPGSAGREGISSPSVAWRAVATPTGEVVVSHQVADTNLGVGTGESAYGGGSGPCTSSIVTPALTSVSLADSASATRVATSRLGGAGPTDIAVSSTGRFALVIAGNAWSESPSVVSLNSPDEGSICPEPPLMPEEDVGEPVAVAFDGSGQAVVQSREPAALYLESGGKIELSSESHANTGLALFHMNTGAGIACASCHPEGTDDAQTWFFSDIGYRRTQMLAGGIRDRAPYHWDGDLPDFDILVDEVMVGRMSLEARPNPMQLEAFLGWVDSVERPIAVVGDAAAVERGKELFFDPTVGCDDCHTGRALTNKRIFDVGTGGPFVVPSLIGIASRAPYLHDGSAKTLHARFSTGGGGDLHGKTSQLSEEQLDDLVTYLETL